MLPETASDSNEKIPLPTEDDLVPLTEAEKAALAELYKVNNFDSAAELAEIQAAGGPEFKPLTEAEQLSAQIDKFDSAAELAEIQKAGGPEFNPVVKQDMPAEQLPTDTDKQDAPAEFDPAAELAEIQAAGGPEFNPVEKPN